MATWTADFAVATEFSRPLLNLILDRFLDELRRQNLLLFSTRLGRRGTLSAELNDLTIEDLEDPPPAGGVVTDVQAQARLRLRLLGFIRADTTMLVRLDDVEVDLSKTPAGLPKGVVLRVTPTTSATITFPTARGLGGWFLNRIVGPVASFGVWLAFRLIRKVEVPVLEIAQEIFSALGLRFASGSPLLTAQKQVAPASLLLASDFNLTNPTLGNPNSLGAFLPAQTNAGAAIHERVLTAAVQTAMSKGWVPTRFRVGKWKIYLNRIGVSFEPGKIEAFGSLKAKRGKCWCRVKARITFRAAVMPRVIDTNTPQPKIAFRYDADLNAHVSTSGMLVVLGVIMFAPVFMAFTIGASMLINLVLNQFLPFKTSWSQGGAHLTVEAQSVHFSGFVPLSMTFALQLSGEGTYRLDRFRQFQLPGGARIEVDYTPESVAVQQDELRLAARLK